MKVWGAEVLTAADLNAEFDNILTNASSLISPLGGSLDWDGYAHTLDAAGVTTAQSTAAIGWSFTPGSKTGTPGTTGGASNWAAATWTDNATAGSGTAASWASHSFQRPTLAASNASVTTTNAATVYVANAPLAGTNETITNPWALWIDAGNVRFDDNIYWLSGTSFWGIFDHANTVNRTYTFPDADGNIPTVASQAEVTAMTSTITAVSPNHNRCILGTYTASSSGTDIDFTGLPSGVRRITVLFVGVSLSGTDDFLVQIGPSGGIESSSYVSTSVAVANAGTAESSSTSGFVIRGQSAAATMSGSMTLCLADTSSNTWVSSHAVKRDTLTTASGGGNKAIAGVLDRVRVTRSGSNTFDAGNITIMYER